MIESNGMGRPSRLVVLYCHKTVPLVKLKRGATEQIAPDVTMKVNPRLRDDGRFFG